MVVDDHVGGLQAAPPAHADERGIAGAGADDVDARRVHCASPHRASRTSRAPALLKSRRHLPAEHHRLVERPAAPGPDHRGAVERDHHRLHVELAGIVDRNRAERQLAAAAERLDQRPLGGQRRACRRIVQRAAPPLASCSSSLRDLDRDDALARGRHAGIERQRRGDPRADAEPPHARGRQDQRVELAGVQLAQARVDVAADRERTSRRAGRGISCAMRRTLLVPIAGAVAERGQRRGEVGRRPIRRQHQRVARVLARQRGGDRRGRRADRPVMSFALCTATSTAPLEQRVFDLLDEQPLAAGLAERPRLQPIAVRLDRDDLDPAPRALLEQRADGRRLPQRQRGCRGSRSGSADRSRARSLARRRRLGSSIASAPRRPGGTAG